MLALHVSGLAKLAVWHQDAANNNIVYIHSTHV